jgi:Zn-dependent protease
MPRIFTPAEAGAAIAGRPARNEFPDKFSYDLRRGEPATSNGGKAMFTRRITLFRLLGFEVKLDLSWLLLAFLVTWSLALGLFPATAPGLASATYWWMGVAGALGLLFSIVFHEFSHALVARRYGLPIHSITLFLFGGVAEMQDEPREPRTEFLMAVAGPISSLVLAFVCYQVYLAVQGGQAAAFAGVMYYLGIINLVLALFNLVPGFPLDGGRMLRAALWAWKGNFRWATRVASQIGGAFGLVLIFLGVFSFVTGNFIGGMWWFLIGLFLRSAAGMSYQQMLVRETIKGERVRRFMNPAPIIVGPEVTLETLVEDYVYRYHHKMYPVVAGDRALGLIGTDQIRAVPRGDWRAKTVAQAMERSTPENTVTPDTDALDAWSRMSRTGRSRMLVVENGRLVGLLSLRDLMQFLSLKFDLEQVRT